MAVPTEITPGVLTPAQAAALSAAMGSAARTAQALAADRVPWVDELPARLTAWDESTQRASWAEETFDANGQRREKTAAEGGRSGTAAWNPAVPVGNGLMPPDQFPVQVWLRRRVATDNAGTNAGVVYEFDWVCACAGAGSGSGPGGTDSGVLVACCPGAIPASLVATFAQTGGVPCSLNGVSVALTYLGPAVLLSAPTWGGPVSVGGTTAFAFLVCESGAWRVGLGFADCGGDIAGNGAATEFATLVSCSPLQVSASMLFDGGGLCPTCPASVWTITVTE